jgi:hypothetical protein
MSQTGRSSRLSYRGVLGAFVVAERKEKGAASDLFKLAKRADGVDDFISQCKSAEEFYLSDAAGQSQVSELPTKWGQAKSDIKGGFKAGLDFSKIASYHKMKILKGEANKPAEVQPEHVQPAVAVTPVADNVVVVEAQVRDDGVIVVPSDDTPVDRIQHVPTGQDKRGARQNPELTMAEALEAGLVLDASTNVLMPEDMRPLVVALNKLDELQRARLIKRFTKEAHDALSRQGDPRRSHSVRNVG